LTQDAVAGIGQALYPGQVFKVSQLVNKYIYISFI